MMKNSSESWQLRPRLCIGKSVIFSKYGRIISAEASLGTASGATDRSNVYDLSRLTIVGTLIFTRPASQSYETTRETGVGFLLSGLMTFDVLFFVPFAKDDR